MRAYELWPTLSKELNHEIFEVACLNDKRLYRRAVDELSGLLRRRPLTVLEMPRAARHELFQPAMGLPKSDVLGHNLAIHWLRATGVPMLALFLDELGIKHDAQGYAEAFPEQLPAEKIERACAALYEKFAAEKVTFYLRLFPNISGVAWDVERFVKK